MIRLRKKGTSSMLNANKIELHLGLKKQVRVLHMTDVHLSLADDSDGDELKAHAAARRETFQREAGFPEKAPAAYLEEAMEYSKNFDATVITGDLMDFTSHANQAEAKRILAGHDYLFTAGNHEFCPRVGVPDSHERKAKILDQIQSNFRGDMVFESRLTGGVNLIAIDNSYFIWTEEQFRRLKEEIERGYPCLLFCHTPMIDGHLNHTPPHHDLKVDDATVTRTRKITEFIVNSPAIAAIFAGHYHYTTVQDLGNGKSCYVLGGLFKGIVGEIIID